MHLMFLRMPLAIGVGLVYLAIGSPASATPLGSLSIANCAGGGVTLTETTVTSLPAGTLAGTGCIETGAGTNVAFSGGSIGQGLAGNILNLTTSSVFPVNNFMTFPAVSPVLDFVLTGLGPGSSNTSCAGLLFGQSCSIVAGSPFVLTSFGTNTTLSLLANGTVADATGTSTWSGLFSSQFNMSAATIQTTILGGGAITSTYSGQFTVASVPEPPALILLGLSLIGLAAWHWKRQGRALS